MKSLPRTEITFPELFAIAGTRVLFGGGMGLLLAGRLRDPQRRAVGWTLLAVGAATTIPLALQVLGRRAALRAAEEDAKQAGEEPQSDLTEEQHTTTTQH